MRIHLFGASGSGVTTLGRYISGLLGIPYLDSDDYFWMPTDPPYTLRRLAAERNHLLQTDLSKQESWAFGGSIIHWGDGLLPALDLCVFLWIPSDLRMARLKQREWRRYGNCLSADPNYRRQHEAFLSWAADYDQPTGIANRNLPAHEAWLARYEGRVLEIRGDYSTEQRWEMIRETLQKPILPVPSIRLPPGRT